MPFSFSHLVPFLTLSDYSAWFFASLVAQKSFYALSLSHFSPSLFPGQVIRPLLVAPGAPVKVGVYLPLPLYSDGEGTSFVWHFLTCLLDEFRL